MKSLRVRQNALHAEPLRQSNLNNPSLQHNPRRADRGIIRDKRLSFRSLHPQLPLQEPPLPLPLLHRWAPSPVRCSFSLLFSLAPWVSIISTLAAP